MNNNKDTIQGMLFQIMHTYHRVCFQQMQTMKVHPGQLGFLHALSHHNGASQRDLAKYLHIKPPTVTVTIQRLEKAELIVKKQDETDQRVSRIYLSEKGEKIAADITYLIRENERKIQRGFTQEELTQMSSLLQRLNTNIEQINQKEGKRIHDENC